MRFCLKAPLKNFTPQSEVVLMNFVGKITDVCFLRIEHDSNGVWQNNEDSTIISSSTCVAVQNNNKTAASKMNKIAQNGGTIACAVMLATLNSISRRLHVAPRSGYFRLQQSNSSDVMAS
jgi:hypothetical protein